MSINWEDFGVWDSRNLPTGWQHVVSLNEGGGYNWSTLHAFWSPTARRFFWHGGSGCSCNSWGDYPETESDFESGPKTALERALREFGDEHRYDFKPGDVIDAIAAVKRFRPEKSE